MEKCGYRQDYGAVAMSRSNGKCCAESWDSRRLVRVAFRREDSCNRGSLKEMEKSEGVRISARITKDQSNAIHSFLQVLTNSHLSDFDLEAMALSIAWRSNILGRRRKGFHTVLAHEAMQWRQDIVVFLERERNAATVPLSRGIECGRRGGRRLFVAVVAVVAHTGNHIGRVGATASARTGFVRDVTDRGCTFLACGSGSCCSSICSSGAFLFVSSILAGETQQNLGSFNVTLLRPSWRWRCLGRSRCRRNGLAAVTSGRRIRNLGNGIHRWRRTRRSPWGCTRHAHEWGLLLLLLWICYLRNKVSWDVSPCDGRLLRMGSMMLTSVHHSVAIAVSPSLCWMHGNHLFFS